MKKRNQTLATLVAICGMSLSPGLMAQDATARVDVNTPDHHDATVQGSVDVDQDKTPDTDKDQIKTRAEYNRNHEGVVAANKASSLIGMEVINPQHQQLGEIKDLVVDMPSGKISYAVLSVGGFLGIGEKLIAVPPSAFSPAPAGQEGKLVLNADKSKIEAAPGFPKTNWPDVSNPSWGAGFGAKEQGDQAFSNDNKIQGNASIGGQELKGEAQIQNDRVEIRSERNDDTDVDISKGSHELKVEGQADVDTHPDLKVETDVHSSGDLEHHNGVTADLDRNQMVFTGRVASVDPQHRTITVKNGSETKQFKLNDQAKIQLDRNNLSQGSIVDLKTGYPVQVRFEKMSDGTMMVKSISRQNPPATR